MAVPQSVVIEHYEAILRSTPSQAQVASLSTLPDVEALDATLLNSADSIVDPVIRLYQSVYGRVPDSGGLDFWVNAYDAGAGLSLTQLAEFFGSSGEFESQYGGLTNGEIVGRMYQNVLGRAGDPGGVTYWTNFLNQGGSIAQLIVEFSESPEFVAKAEQPIDEFLLGAAAGQDVYTNESLFTFEVGYFQLTPGTDDFVGTDGDNIFDAPLAIGADFTVNTLTSNDHLVGGGTSNKLFAEFDDAAGGDLSINVQEIEQFYFTARGAGATVDFEDGARHTTGAQELWNIDSEAGLTLTDVNELIVDGAPVAVGFQNQESFNSYFVEFRSNVVSGADDEVDVVLADLGGRDANAAEFGFGFNQGVGAAGLLVIQGTATGGVETWNLTSVREVDPLTGEVAEAELGFWNNITGLQGTNFTNLNIDGDQDLDVGQLNGNVRILDNPEFLKVDQILNPAALASSVRNVDATAFQGNLRIDVLGDDFFSPADEVTTVNLGGGDDRLAVLSWSDNDIATGGAGVDTLIAGIDGFFGSVDFLETSGAFSGFETLELKSAEDGVTVDLENISTDVERIVLNGSDNGDFFVDNLSKAIAAGDGVIITSAVDTFINEVEINVDGANGFASINDTLNITVAGNSNPNSLFGLDGNALDIDSLDIDGIETLNLVSTGGFSDAVNEIDDLDMDGNGSIDTLNLSGDTEIHLGEDGAISTGIFNAAGLSADLELLIDNEGHGVTGAAWQNLNAELDFRYAAGDANGIIVTGGTGSNLIELEDDLVGLDGPFLINVGDGGDDVIVNFRGNTVANDNLLLDEDLIVINGTSSLADLINSATISVGRGEGDAAGVWDLVIDFNDDARGSVTIDDAFDLGLGGSFDSVALDLELSLGPNFGPAFVDAADNGLVELTDAQVTILFQGVAFGVPGIGDSFFYQV